MTIIDLEQTLYTARQCSEIDRLAIDQGPITGYQLMQQAGKRVFDQVQCHFAHCQPVLIACGSGNNGGDGYVVARCLKQLGVAVQVLQAAIPTTESCKQACTDYVQVGGEVTDDFGLIRHAGLLVDAMLGAGLGRAPEGRYRQIIEEFNARDAPCLAIDLPSGLNGDTGAAYAPAVKADLTVTFIAKKAGLYTGAGSGLSGEVVFESLALDSVLLAGQTPVASIIQAPQFRPRPVDSHKGLFGRLVVLGGDSGMLGAAILAGRAALRSGAGTVTLACAHAALDLGALVQPELMSQVAETREEFLAAADAADVLVVGPGTGMAAWSTLLFGAIANLDVPRVVDAGALRLLAGSATLYRHQVLTPHPGEAAALLDCSSVEIQHDRLAAAGRICRQYGGVCVLKGAGTVVSDGQRNAVCIGGNPGMSSAGMGDVLSGIIGSLMAQGQAPFEAACAGVYLHAEAADQIAAKIGQQALLASDIVNQLGPVIMQCTH